jgi:tRNA-specific 2-thiouridylase
MRVVVAMSGGVDSSVSALLLREQGHDVIGVFLRNGVEAPVRGHGHGCCGTTDALDAQEVASSLSIPFYALDHAREFGRIVDAFVETYARGETPNPCVQCNRELKFGALLEFARAMGADRLATGHYARLEPEPGGGASLLRARDRAKDQSYVLATVARDALARTLFPVGDLAKAEVREHARRAGLPVHAKPESQEICFVPSGDHRDLLRARRPESFRRGRVIDESGIEVGEHGGAIGFTVGQRRGLGLALGEPRYVVATDPRSNTVVVGPREALLRQTCALTSVNWLSERPTRGTPVRVALQVRAHHAAVPATAREDADGRVLLELDPPGEAVTPGQVGALYSGERVVAGGTLAPA